MEKGRKNVFLNGPLGHLFLSFQINITIFPKNISKQISIHYRYSAEIWTHDLKILSHFP